MTKRALLQKVFPTNEEHEAYVLKLGWPSKELTSEAKIIQALVEALPASLHAHLPQIDSYATSTAGDLDLPCTALASAYHSEKHQERQFCAFAVKGYQKLSAVETAGELRQVWLDCVECGFRVVFW